jgi:hypothetical protein
MDVDRPLCVRDVAVRLTVAESRLGIDAERVA